MQPNLGISEKDLQKTNKTLTVLLANETVLYLKTRKFHWNISGNSFLELHVFFRTSTKHSKKSLMKWQSALVNLAVTP